MRDEPIMETLNEAHEVSKFCKLPSPEHSQRETNLSQYPEYAKVLFSDYINKTLKLYFLLVVLATNPTEQ